MPNSPISFFDQNNKDQTPFSFTAPLASHTEHITKPSTVEAHLVCTNPSSNQVLKGFFKLQSHFLFYYKDEHSDTPLLVLNVLYAKLSEVEIFFANPKYKLKITKKTATFELAFNHQTDAEQWFDALRSLCIFSNLHEKYTGIRLLGQGAFGAVHLVKSNKTNEHFAVKGFSKMNLKNTQSKLAILNEIAMMRAHDHPNLVKLHEVHETEGSIYLVMDYISGQTLRSFLSKPDLPPSRSESQNMNIASSILNSLAYFESQGSMHRDLKPDNILMDKQGNLKIIDFGLVTFCNQDDYIFDRCGTPGYIAPEVFNYKKKADNGNPGYDGKCDVFSAGCILFQILFGFRLFNGKDAAGVLQLNKTFNYDQISEIIQAEINEGKSKINKEGLGLLLKMLHVDPKKRISAFDALAHDYFTPLYDNLPKSLGSNMNLGSFRKSKHNVESSSLLSSNLQYSANQCLHTLSGDQSPPSFHLDEERSLCVHERGAAASIDSESAASSEFSNKVIIPFQGSRVKKLAAKFPLNIQKNAKTSLFGQSKLGLSPPKSPFKVYSQAPSTGDISAELVETESDDTAHLKNYVDTYKTPIFLKQSGKMVSLNRNMQRKEEAKME